MNPDSNCKRRSLLKRPSTDQTRSINSPCKVRFNELVSERSILADTTTITPAKTAAINIGQDSDDSVDAQTEAQGRLEPPAPESTVQLPDVIRKTGRITIGQYFIAVDTFRKSTSFAFRFHFLTHAHMDHIVGLDADWKEKVYCSEATAALLPVLAKKKLSSRKSINPELLVPLKTGVRHTLEANFNVTLIDANHCIGSVMYLFEGAFVPGGAILCTGDFRADSLFLEKLKNDEMGRHLMQTHLSKLYLDNMYLSYEADTLPDQQSATKKIIEIATAHPDTTLILPVYKVGRDTILDELSVATGECIGLFDFRWSIHLALQAAGLAGSGSYVEVTSSDESRPRIFTIQRSVTSLKAALKTVADPYYVVDLTIRDDIAKHVPPDNFLRVPFTDHSSRDELKQFLSCLSFSELVPTCAEMTSESYKELQSLSSSSRQKSASCEASTSADSMESCDSSFNSFIPTAISLSQQLSGNYDVIVEEQSAPVEARSSVDGAVDPEPDSVELVAEVAATSSSAAARSDVTAGSDDLFLATPATSREPSLQQPAVSNEGVYDADGSIMIIDSDSPATTDAAAVPTTIQPAAPSSDTTLLVQEPPVPHLRPPELPQPQSTDPKTLDWSSLIAPRPLSFVLNGIDMSSFAPIPVVGPLPCPPVSVCVVSPE